MHNRAVVENCRLRLTHCQCHKTKQHAHYRHPVHFTFLQWSNKCWALAFYFFIRTWYLFLLSKCRGESNLGLCMSLVLAKSMRLHSADIWFKDVFGCRICRESALCSSILFGSNGFMHRPMMMIAFITVNSGLVPFIEGLCAQIWYFRFKIIGGLRSHLLLFFFGREYVQEKSSQSKISFCLLAYTYTCVICTHVWIHMCWDLEIMLFIGKPMGRSIMISNAEI